MDQLQRHIVLVYSGLSRVSGQIIEEQQQHVRQHDREPLEAMHLIKMQASDMRNVLQKGDMQALGQLLDAGFQHKKKMARHISNSRIDTIYQAARRAGASGGKISGAGGGGFLFFCCAPEHQNQLIQTLDTFELQPFPFKFTRQGVTVNCTQDD